jgi:hypothetical protein
MNGGSIPRVRFASFGTDGSALRGSRSIRFSLPSKTTEAGGPRGYDAGKKINGRKRHALVDTDGRGLVPRLGAIRSGGRLFANLAMHPKIAEAWFQLRAHELIACLAPRQMKSAGPSLSDFDAVISLSQGARPRCAAHPARPRRRGDRVRPHLCGLQSRQCD